MCHQSSVHNCVEYLSPALLVEAVNRLDTCSGQHSLRRVLRVENETGIFQGWKEARIYVLSMIMFFCICIFSKCCCKISSCKAVVLNDGLFYSVTLDPQHVLMSGDICDCHNWWWWGCYWHLVDRGQGAAKHPTIYKRALHNKELSGPKGQQREGWMY